MTHDQAYQIVKSCDRTIRGAFAVWIETTAERMYVLDCEKRILTILSDDLKHGRLDRVENCAPCTSFGADPDLKPGPLTQEDRGWDPQRDGGIR
jgi:hypothetical protein